MNHTVDMCLLTKSEGGLQSMAVMAGIIYSDYSICDMKRNLQ